MSYCVVEKTCKTTNDKTHKTQNSAWFGKSYVYVCKQSKPKSIKYNHSHIPYKCKLTQISNTSKVTLTLSY